ncbi:hypothetical protein ACTXT7_011785 [Hymenolepis weldensis]
METENIVKPQGILGPNELVRDTTTLPPTDSPPVAVVDILEILSTSLISLLPVAAHDQSISRDKIIKEIGSYLCWISPYLIYVELVFVYLLYFLTISPSGSPLRPQYCVSWTPQKT